MSKAREQARIIATAIHSQIKRQGPQIVFLAHGEVKMAFAPTTQVASDTMDRIARKDGEEARGYYTHKAVIKHICDDLLHAHEVDGWPLKLGPVPRRRR